MLSSLILEAIFLSFFCPSVAGVNMSGFDCESDWFGVGSEGGGEQPDFFLICIDDFFHSMLCEELLVLEIF